MPVGRREAKTDRRITRTRRPARSSARQSVQHRRAGLCFPSCRGARPGTALRDRRAFEASRAELDAFAKAHLPVNVSRGVGSLTWTSDPANPYRSIFGPGYSASKTALNAMTLAMAIELESTGIKVNACSPGFTRTNLNGYAGTETVEEGAREAVRLSLLGPDGPTGTFSHATLGALPW